MSSWSADAWNAVGDEVTLDMSRERRIFVRFVHREGISSLDLVSDLSTFLPVVGYTADNLDTFDMNGADDGNGIPDAAEFALLEAVLKYPSLSFSKQSGIAHEPLWTAWTQNVTQATLDLPQGTPSSSVRAVAAYMTLGDYRSARGVALLLDQYVSGHAVDPDAYDTQQQRYKYDRSGQQFLYCHRDTDNDGLTNRDDWNRANGDRALFVQYALDGNASAPPPEAGGGSGTGNGSGADSQCKNFNCIDDCAVHIVNPYIRYGCTLEVKVDGNTVSDGDTRKAGETIEVECKESEDVEQAQGYRFEHWDMPNTLIDASRQPKEHLVLPRGAVTVKPFLETYRLWFAKANGCGDVSDPTFNPPIVEVSSNEEGWKLYQGPRGSHMMVSASPGSFQGHPCIPLFTAYNYDSYSASANVRMGGQHLLGSTGTHVPSPIDPLCPQKIGAKSCVGIGGGEVTIGAHYASNQGSDTCIPFAASASYPYCDQYGTIVTAWAFHADAHPDPGWHVALRDNARVRPHDFTADDSIVIHFQKNDDFELKVEGGGKCQGYVAVSPARRYYSRGVSVSVSAKPSLPYRFVSWQGDGVDETGAPIEGNMNPNIGVVMDRDRTVIPTHCCPN